MWTGPLSQLFVIGGKIRTVGHFQLYLYLSKVIFKIFVRAKLKSTSETTGQCQNCWWCPLVDGVTAGPGSPSLSRGRVEGVESRESAEGTVELHYPASSSPGDMETRRRGQLASGRPHPWRMWRGEREEGRSFATRTSLILASSVANELCEVWLEQIIEAAHRL